MDTDEGKKGGSLPRHKRIYSFHDNPPNFFEDLEDDIKQFTGQGDRDIVHSAIKPSFDRAGTSSTHENSNHPDNKS
jgi:hypothetical protein